MILSDPSVRRLKAAGCLLVICLVWAVVGHTQENADAPRFNVIAIYTGTSDLAHVSFVREANRWFSEAARAHNFSYESTTDWTSLSGAFLARYQVVLFLDTRPEDPAQRDAFRKYMENDGAWMGFHFAGFAL